MFDEPGFPSCVGGFLAGVRLGIDDTSRNHLLEVDNFPIPAAVTARHNPKLNVPRPGHGPPVRARSGPGHTSISFASLLKDIHQIAKPVAQQSSNCRSTVS